MFMTRMFSKCFLLALLIAFLGCASFAQQSQLGQVDFPTSGSAQAQVHFLRGLAALHSFWYEEAADEFRQATKIDPDFMMGYWGEAMTHNHPLWGQQDTETGRKIVAKIRDTPKLTAKERAYINALRVLYADGEKAVRDIGYSAVMQKMYADYPDDLEAASFYALSLLGLVRPGDTGFRRQMQAGAIALRVYEKNPNHPGAAHYAIHAFDDPEHAIIALPAARRYAAIAPEAFHARHMPAHIFLQLGMWPEAAASNESAWAVSVAWSGRKGLPLSARDYHSNHWLLYVYLQQGRYGKAEEVLAIKHQDMAAAGNDRAVRRSYFEMLGIFGFETGQWELASKLSSENEVKVVAPAAADGGTHGGHGGAAASASPTPKAAAPVQGPRYRSDVFPPAFIRGVAAAMAGNAAEVEKVLAQLRATREQLKGEDQAYGARLTEIRELMLSAIAGTAKGEYESAIESMKRATGLEEQMSPPSGPPETIKPTHELFGEILLKAGKPQEAAKQFATALLRQPNRSRSLLGAARAAAQMGDKATAMRMYSDLLRVWQQADAQLPELREARDYVAQNKSSVAIAGR